MNDTNTINIGKQFGSDLSSRSVASSLRRQVETADLTVALDFSDVRSLSDSFADEFFAVLAEEKGFDWFSIHVKVVGLNPVVRQTVLRAVHLRCETASTL